MREWKEVFHANENQKKAGVAILVSDKTGFTTKAEQETRTLHNDQGINPRTMNKNKYAHNIEHLNT